MFEESDYHIADELIILYIDAFLREELLQYYEIDNEDLMTITIVPTFIESEHQFIIDRHTTPEQLDQLIDDLYDFLDDNC